MRRTDSASRFPLGEEAVPSAIDEINATRRVAEAERAQLRPGARRPLRPVGLIAIATEWIGRAVRLN